MVSYIHEPGRSTFPTAARHVADQARTAQSVGDNPSAITMRCSKCDKDATLIYSGKVNYCDRHYRIFQMRRTSRVRGTADPGDNALEALFDAATVNGMICPCCHRVMAMRGKRESGKMGCVISIQHDHCGAIRLICHSCNNSHRAYPNDSFYSLPVGHKRCGRCAAFKPFEDFCFASGPALGNRHHHCRKCLHEMYKERMHARNKLQARNG